MTHGRRLSQDTPLKSFVNQGTPTRTPKVCIRKHLNWKNADWGRVMFSDESSLYSDDRRRRVHRRPGESYSQMCIVRTVQYGHSVGR
ncbi:hypothetical protein BDFB_013033, partial [Asbolus verrucosus]